MATDPKELEDFVNRAVARLIPMLARFPTGGLEGGYACTGSKFACGQYKCPTTPGAHSCRDVFECNITFTEPSSLQR
jgi:hypothetical protein